MGGSTVKVPLLRRFVARREVRDLLAELRASAGPFTLGEHGSADQPEQAILVDLDGSPWCWVSGPAAPTVAAMLRYAGREELTRRAARAETLARYREINLLHRFSERLDHPDDPQELAQAALEEARRFLGAHTGAVWVEGDRGVEILAHVGPPEDVDLLAQAVFADGASRLVDAAEEGRCPETVGTVMCTPMRHGLEVIGTLRLWSETPGAWTASDARIVDAVGSRTAALLHSARLRDRAEAASAAKSDFLARMSHELRSPLAAIIGYAELIAEQLDEGEHVADLARILSAGRHLLELINDVLNLSRVESGQLQLLVEEVDVAALLGGVVDVAVPIAEAHRTTLVSDLQPGMTVRTDGRRLRQVVQNLVSNACKFSPRGEVRLLAWMAHDDLHVSVTDTGIGMTPEQLERAFDPFTQADASIGARFGGSGLGLAISKRLIEALGGSIDADSAAGVGTRFHIVLPADADPPGALSAGPG